MATRSKPSVLGNDPFHRGAALRVAPEAKRATEVPPAPIDRPTQPAAVQILPAEGAQMTHLRHENIPLAEIQETPSSWEAAVAAGGMIKRLLGITSGPPALDVDELGRDATFERKTRPLFAWMHDRWFRVDARGFDKLPRTGPTILVANRAGAIPWDGAMLSHAAFRHGREVRPLVEDYVFHFPGMGVLANRLGAVRACPENAERLLSDGHAIAVFPEGATGFGKPFRERYRLQRFGRGGFIKLALRCSAKIVPVSIVGSEEIYPLLGRVPARLLGLPFVPITPTWPLLGLAGLVPLPTKWTIEIGDPFDFSSYGKDAAANEPLVLRLAEQVREAIQAMLDAELATRTSVF